MLRDFGVDPFVGGKWVTLRYLVLDVYCWAKLKISQSWIASIFLGVCQNSKKLHQRLVKHVAQEFRSWRFTLSVLPLVVYNENSIPHICSLRVSDSVSLIVWVRKFYYKGFSEDYGFSVFDFLSSGRHLVLLRLVWPLLWHQRSRFSWHLVWSTLLWQWRSDFCILFKNKSANWRHISFANVFLSSLSCEFTVFSLIGLQTWQLDCCCVLLHFCVTSSFNFISQLQSRFWWRGYLRPKQVSWTFGACHEQSYHCCVPKHVPVFHRCMISWRFFFRSKLTSSITEGWAFWTPIDWL